MISRFMSVVTSWINGAMAILFLLMTLLVCLQVFYRYVLNSPLVGSEEAARTLLLYIVMIGSAVAIGNRSHMAIDYFHERFPRSLKRLSSIVYYAVLLFIAVLFIKEGYDLAQRTMMMKTPALQLSRGALVLAFPISGALMILYIVGLLAQRGAQRTQG
ncbi:MULTISPECIES: TRAP transporter small permease [Salinicola]|uniref:TRAP transporter small permease n=1 Tax=Salinicola TaxID=404432 RepID=UPI0013EBF5E4|nr:MULTISPECIES: TRAP transporter small permease [Salinicola]MCE3026665.1 TRAP transporter small permease [Salinicola sp. DM10]